MALRPESTLSVGRVVVQYTLFGSNTMSGLGQTQMSFCDDREGQWTPQEH